MKLRLTVVMMLAVLFAGVKANAQTFAVKTNLLYDATATINLGAEVAMAPKWTLDVNGDINMWKIKDMQWKHLMIQPEVRYWLCEKFQGNFLAAHLIGGAFSFGNMPNLCNFLGSDFGHMRDNLYKGWAAGVGIAYGHTWVLAEHWNLEAEIGVGYIWSRYKVHDWNTGRQTQDYKNHNYFGPTKLALNLEYVF